MSGQTMSVTQALAELKLLRRRIDSALTGAKFVTIVTKKSMVDKGRFETQARASMQSYRDLMERYYKIKSAIVRSNAVTEVAVAGRTYSVAEAVERKRSIDQERNLLRLMMDQYEEVTKAFERHRDSEQARVDRMLAVELGKDSKTNIDVVKSLTETILAENRAEIVDPLNIATQIAETKKSIEEFETNVDWVLSECNGKTMITV
jgi:hypothetical protein